jgi:hypothetical protein
MPRMRRQDLIDQVIDYLAYVKAKVEISNAVRLTDINIHAEDFYCGLLNLVYGYSLVNINIDNRDAVSIDLGDTTPGVRLAIQVTSTDTFKKVRDTFSSFIAKELHRQYDRLVILNIRTKLSHRTKKLGADGAFQLDVANDLWDVGDLASKIKAMTDVSKLKDIVFYLHTNLQIQQGQTLANEVLTILRLVELLGEGSTRPASRKDFKDDPDPTGKVYRRFANEAAFLTDSYVRLFPYFGQLMVEVRDRSELPSTSIELMQFHLQEESDRVLTECDGDPKLALQKLQDHYGSLLRERGIAHNTQAVRFFLVDQLTRCNVFPEEKTLATPVS